MLSPFILPPALEIGMTWNIELGAITWELETCRFLAHQLQTKLQKNEKISDTKTERDNSTNKFC